ncbi:hypothetical protein R1sor_022007 [Riccia sorocarpa]|uniref:CCHC-type domain-containing protein n=1 Tax=Riccia sorocarpa TaxID=122646 RepID=A0ABD3GKB5_9MARC
MGSTAKNAWSVPLKTTMRSKPGGDPTGSLLQPYLENLDPSWGRLVSADRDFHPTKLYANILPVWLDLPRVHPLIEQYGDAMLDVIGEVLYKPIDKQTNQYSNISACILVDLAKPLKDTVDIIVYGTVIWSQIVHYHRLPDTCFNCQQRGHWVKECPKCAKGDAEKEGTDTETDATGRGKGKPGEAVATANEVSTSSTSQTKTQERGKASLKVDSEGFQTVSRRKPKRNQGKSTVLDKGGQFKMGSGSKPKFRDPNARAYRRATGSFTEESSGIHTSESSEEDGEYYSTDEEMKDHDEEQSEETEGGNEETHAEGTDMSELKDLNSQDLPTLSHLQKDLNQDQTGPTIIEKRRMKDGEDTHGFRRQSLHPADTRAQLFSEIGGPSNRATESQGGPQTQKDKNTMMKELNFGTWNVRGVGKVQKLKMIKKCTNTLDFRTTILALQELKVKGWKLERRLQSIFPDGKYTVDFSRKGKSRVGLFIHSSFTILAEGTSGQGYGSWAKLQIGSKEIGVLALHAPNKRRNRIKVWKWMEETIRAGNG